MENTVKFKTTLKCGGCIAKVKPLLDGAKEIKKWSVDLGGPDRTLTVELKDTDPEIIVKILESGGYKAELIK